MRFVVCLKQVPDSTVRVKPASDGKGIDGQGVTWSISPYDEYAIELALEHKDKDASTVVSVVHKSEKEPRYPSLPGIMKAKKKDIPEKALDSLGVSASGPRLEILAMASPPQRGQGKILKVDGDAKGVAEQLAKALHEEAKVI